MRQIILNKLMLVVISSCVVVAASAKEAFTYQKTLVKDDIWVLTGAGGNIGVLESEEGLLVIDNGFGDNWPALKSSLEGFSTKPLYQLNTHWHGDHTGANESMSAHAVLIAHENVRQRMKKGMTVGERVTPPATFDALPKLTYQAELNFYFADQHVSAIHLPKGHTDGDTVVWFQPANVVHTGDLMFAGYFPYIDPQSGGSVDGYMKNVASIIEQIDDQTIVIPGHGPVTDRQGLKDFYQMMQITSASVKEMKQQGISLEQAQEKGLGDRWLGWGDFFIDEAKWISTLWRSSGG